MSPAVVGKSITESPWYWAYVFSAAGLVALIIMGPRFASRQLQIEKKSQARQSAARHVAGQLPSVSPTPGSGSEETLTVRLWLLHGVLGALLVVAVWNLFRGRVRKQRLARTDAAE